MNSKVAENITPLTRVTLTLQSAPADQQNSSDAPPTEFEFICGLGIEGLTGFEMDLMEKKPGDRLTLPVDTHKAADYFEHLLTPFMQAVNTCPPFNLFVEVRSVSAVSEKELVHALAHKVDNSSCGDDCSCGCH